MATAESGVKSDLVKLRPAKSKAAKEAETKLKQAQRAAILLKQVSDPTRLQVVLMLGEGNGTSAPFASN